MAQTHIVNDDAVFRLLSGVASQARKDLCRKRVAPHNRVSAYMVYDTILEVIDADTERSGPGTRPTNLADVQSANRQVFGSAGSTRGSGK